MRETLSLLRFHTYNNILSGHYFHLIEWWGWQCIFTDTWDDGWRRLKLATGARLAIYAKSSGCEPPEKPDFHLWKWQKMPKGYRWF